MFFVNADSKEVSGRFGVNADSKGLRALLILPHAITKTPPGGGAILYKSEYTSWYRFVKQFIFAGESVGCGDRVGRGGRTGNRGRAYARIERLKRRGTEGAEKRDGRVLGMG